MRNMAFRSSFFFSIGGNLLFIFLLYFLWQAIYRGSAQPTINGMSFHDTYLYLCIANVLYLLFASGVDYWMAGTIGSGDIVMTLVKPMDWQLQLMSMRLGAMAFNLLTVTVPTFIVISILLRPGIRLGVNLLFILPSCALAFTVSYLFDFFVGLIAFYTQSFWGFSMIKNYVIRAISGSMVPLALFPGALRTVMDWLPFKAIYDIPTRLLMDRSLDAAGMLSALAFQAAWAIILFLASRLAFNRSIQRVMIHGG